MSRQNSDFPADRLALPFDQKFDGNYGFFSQKKLYYSAFKTSFHAYFKINSNLYQMLT